MQVSSLSKRQQMALAREASKLPAKLEVACITDATVCEDEAEDLWTIAAYPRACQAILRMKNPNTDNYSSCLLLQ